MFVSLNNLSIDQLETGRSFFNVMLGFATLAVLIGVYFEKDENPDDVKKWGWRAVTRGVALELFCGVMLWQIDSLISGQEQAGLANTYSRAASAEKAAGEAYERAAKAELEIARINARRQLNPAQFAELVKALRPYQGRKYWVTIERSDQDESSEQSIFGNQMATAFRLAGWIRESHLTSNDPNKAEAEFNAVSDRGCNLSFNPVSKPIADLFSERLHAAGIKCEQHLWPDLRPDAMILEIGLR